MDFAVAGRRMDVELGMIVDWQSASTVWAWAAGPNGMELTKVWEMFERHADRLVIGFIVGNARRMLGSKRTRQERSPLFTEAQTYAGLLVPVFAGDRSSDVVDQMMDVLRKLTEWHDGPFGRHSPWLMDSWAPVITKA